MKNLTGGFSEEKLFFFWCSDQGAGQKQNPKDIISGKMGIKF